MLRRLSLLSVCVSVSLFLACAGVETPGERGGSAPVFRGAVSAEPGAVAWAPDSASFAFVAGGDIHVHRVGRGETGKTRGISPVRLAWSPAEALMAIGSLPDGRRQLYAVSGDGSVTEQGPLSEGAEALWRHPATGDVLLLVVKARRMSIGTFVTYQYERLAEGSALFSWDAHFPTTQTGLDFVSGWVYSGLRPVHETLLMPEFHRPPVILPFTKFRTFDPVTGDVGEIGLIPTGRTAVHASWSPDGSRMALADDDGHLGILTAEGDGGFETVNREGTGLFPAWNPQGSQVYFGGTLMQSDGTAVRSLLPGAVKSLGVWSPDGTRLLVATGEELYLFEGFSPSFAAPDGPPPEDVRDKLRTLKDLLREELISRDEYLQRSERLLGRRKVAP